MSAEMGPNRYGKAGIRLATVQRGEATHGITQLLVDVAVEGDFRAVHMDGDNRAVLATDTMRGAAYALARERGGVTTPELFGLELAAYCLDAAPAVSRATVSLDAQPWERLEVQGRPHPHTFTPSAGGRRTAVVARARDGTAEARAGVADLRLLKTTGSAFSDYVHDRYTTLPETEDRILATTVSAEWRYAGLHVDFDQHATDVPRQIRETFAQHDESQSVQHTLYAMGNAVLAACPDVTDISFTLPNEHHILADLQPYGLDNPGEVFVVADRPYGLIEGTVTRA